MLVAIVVAVLLSLLGLSLTFMSLKEAGNAVEFENHEKALMVADGGLQMVKRTMRAYDLTEMLNMSASVPYASGGRMPILPIDARNINFESGAGTGASTCNGLLTPPDGQLIALGDVRGRFFAKVSDDPDEAAVTGTADDPLTDSNNMVYVRVVGIYRGIGGEVTSYGSSRKNSVAVVEALLKRDQTFDLNSPISFYGHNVTSGFAGNSFTIDGYDHSGMTFDQITKGHSDAGLEPQYGVTCLYDDQNSGDAQAAVNDVNNSLSKNQKNNITGAGGFPSITDGTDTVRDDTSNPDGTNIFDADFLANFVNQVSAVADVKYETDAHISANPGILGTEGHPLITVAEADLELSGNGSGVGILIVKGAFKVSGAFTFDGVILVVGEGDVTMGGTNKSFVGGMYVANVQENGANYKFGTPTLSDSGNSNFYMDSDSIRLAYSLLPMRLISWREITPEIEPGS